MTPKPETRAEKIRGQVRHWAGLGAGVLIGMGIADQADAATITDNMEAIAGAVIALVAMVDSWVRKN